MWNKKGLWVFMMCQCKFISCNKCTTQVGDINSAGGSARVGQGVYEKSVLSAQFFCDPQTTLKNKVCFFFKWIHLTTVTRFCPQNFASPLPHPREGNRLCPGFWKERTDKRGKKEGNEWKREEPHQQRAEKPGWAATSYSYVGFPLLPNKLAQT